LSFLWILIIRSHFKVETKLAKGNKLSKNSETLFADENFAGSIIYAISNPILFTKSIKGELSLLLKRFEPTTKGSILELTFLVRFHILPAR